MNPSLLAEAAVAGSLGHRPVIRELAGMIEPALLAGLEAAVARPAGQFPDRQVRSFPSFQAGAYTALSYHFPAGWLADRVTEFVAQVDREWSCLGMQVREHDAPGVLRHFAGRNGYSLWMTVNLRSQQVLIAGLGPGIPTGAP